MKFIFFIFSLILLTLVSSNKFEDKEWSPEKFLTGKFINNLGSKCNLIAKDGKISGTYITKPSRGTLIEKKHQIYGTYTPVEDGVLLSFIVTFKMEGKNKEGLKKISTASWNGKAYSNEKSFRMNWLLVSNERKNNEWTATNLGQDHFTKIK